jgi:hypothetical protein
MRKAALASRLAFESAGFANSSLKGFDHCVVIRGVVGDNGEKL